MSDTSGIDPQGLKRLNRIGGSDFVRQMIDLFLKEAPERLRAVRAGESAGDLKAVTETCHALKSSARNFGAERLAEIAQKIELGTQATSGENLSELISSLEREYADVEAWLENERHSLK